MTTTFHIEHHTQLTSTNDCLMQQASTQVLPEFHTVWAEEQTKGKGQKGNSWESEPGMNLTFSTLLHPTHIAASAQFTISEIVAIAVWRTLSRRAEGFSVKWPNDIYWHDRKICGILIEHILQGSMLRHSIVGIGLNVNQVAFRSDAPNPISLRQITAQHTPRQQLLNELLAELANGYATPTHVHDEFLQALYRREGFHPYRDKDGLFVARIANVLPTGTLVLQDESGCLRHYLFKEVQYVPERP